VTATATRTARRRELTGFVVLTRGAERRRIPYWLRVSAPSLARKRPKPLLRPGLHAGTTRGASARVRTYRYPANVAVEGVTGTLPGPEQVYRVRLRRPAANFGVAIVWKAKGVRVEPRIVRAGDEDRLLGQTALPINLNPYVGGFLRREPTAGAIRPAKGSYDVVFDTPVAAQAGKFTFRLWIGDTSPPTVRLLSPGARGRLPLSIVDRGSGVDPRTIVASVDGDQRTVAYSRATGRASLSLANLSRGRHRLAVVVSDYQETKNMEDVPPILPNTRVFQTTFTVR
jgi:hypothetical protein